MALPASIVLPPPKAITSSQAASRASWVPCRTRSTVGSPSIGKRIGGGSPAIPTRARSAERRVTTNARRPISAAAAGTCRTVPAPKTIRVAVANSKRMPLYQPSSSGETLVYITLARGSAIISSTVSRQVW